MNSRQTKILMIAVWWSLLVSLGQTGCAKAQEPRESRWQPNVVFILADDFGWSQLGAYGSDYYRSPNIDQLARQGARFSNAYAAAAVCSPTRASIMTGKHPARLGITDFIPGNTIQRDPLDEPVWQKFLPLSEKTLGELFQEAGYRTAFLGKWHLSKTKTPPGSESHNPAVQGFNDSFVTFKPSAELGQSWQTPEDDGHNVRLLTEKAVDFVTRHIDEPFFLMVSHNTIHDPLMEKHQTIDRYRRDPRSTDPRNNPVLGAMIETLDHSVGTLLRVIDEQGLANNTIVIFYSDNGGLKRDAAQTPLREGKAWLYEGGIRVPLIVRWPGHIDAGRTIDTSVSSIDLAPTFHDILAAKSSRDHYDGVSLLPVLVNDDAALPRRPLYWHYPHYHTAGMSPASAIRDGDFKLIEWYEPQNGALQSRFELYNLANDIGEAHDLAADEPERVAHLRTALDAWKRSVGANMPTVPTGELIGAR